MPAAYDTNPKRFDDLMADVCPGSRDETNLRIEAWVAARVLIAIESRIDAGVEPLRAELAASKERDRLTESLGLKR